MTPAFSVDTSGAVRERPCLMFNIRGVVLTGAIFFSVFGLAQADVYRFASGQHPEGAANPAMCLDATQPWYPSASTACQGAKSVLPNCDRATATYRNYVATLTSPTQCNVSFEFQNVGQNTWGSFAHLMGISIQA
jgi:hypothetical protein